MAASRVKCLSAVSVRDNPASSVFCFKTEKALPRDLTLFLVVI